jgi:hypothetical protein
MICSISEEVPAAWDHIINTFITMVEFDVEFNNGTPIVDMQCSLRYGLLAITYSGGDRITDAFAMFAKEMSVAICSECSLPSTRVVFESPKCDDCY